MASCFDGKIVVADTIRAIALSALLWGSIYSPVKSIVISRRSPLASGFLYTLLRLRMRATHERIL